LTVIIFGIDAREWVAIFALGSTLIGVVRYVIINPLIKTYHKSMENYVQPFADKLDKLGAKFDALGGSIDTLEQTSRVQHDAIHSRITKTQKRVDEVEKRVNEHGEDISYLKGVVGNDERS
jgi:DNA-binding ferritin-like protein